MRNELIRQFLRRLRGKKTGMRVSELIELLVHRRKYVWMRMAETGHCRATGRIDVFLAGTVTDTDPAGGGSGRVGVADLAMQNVGHDRRSKRAMPSQHLREPT